MRTRILVCAALLGLFGCAKTEESTVSSAPVADPSVLVLNEAIPALPGEPVTVYAGLADGAETRSRIALDGSAAKVLWTAGDSFQTIYSSGDIFRTATFTTQDDGVTEAAFTTNSQLSGSSFHCYYPSAPSGKWGTYNGYNIFGVSIPAEQTAVAGGIVEKLNVAYAYADHLTKNLEEPLKFYNIPSLLKFRMEGAVVSRVKEITFSAPGTIAGNLIYREVDGIPEEYPNLSYTDDVHSPKVTLKGDFEAGVDYYIALYPREMSWFRMELSDGDGNSTVKQSAKAVTFERSRIKDFGTIDLGDEFVDIDDGSLDPVLYMAATEGKRPVTIAVIPEGFTKEELPQYELLAKAGINKLFETEPYKTYQNRFNVYILKVASYESGASITDGNGNITTPVASYFGARWGQNSYGDMRADDSTVFNFVTEHCPDITDGSHAIYEVPILMIINDTRFGGMCWSYSNGRGFSMVPYTGEGGGLMWSMPSVVATTDDPLPEPVTEEVVGQYARKRTQQDLDEVGGFCYGDWRNILIHEFGGHCFGRLGDEYWSDTPSYISGPINTQTVYSVPFALNLAAAPSEALWKEVLLDRMDVLTAKDPNYARIGIFQGGDYHLFGRWRSEKISCMVDNRAYFSAWQRYLIAQRIFSLSGDTLDFETWLAKDVTIDPVRDVSSSGAPGVQEHRSYTLVGPLPPPRLIEE